MDLRRKLERLDGTRLSSGAPGHVAATSAPAPAPPEPASPQGAQAHRSSADREQKLRRNLSGLRPPQPSGSAKAAPAVRSTGPAAFLTGETALGPVYFRERWFRPEHHHGAARLGEALNATPRAIAALACDERLANLDPSRLLLLDLETTGLSGGTGTLPFLVGLGWFEEGCLRVVQLFLRRPGEERPVLHYFQQRLERADALLSFNGKTFDWPLLRARFVMNRLKPPEPTLHVDLLHCARRVYRFRSAGARLTDLEAEVIGHRRHGDIPGELIPERYFRYLRTGQVGLIQQVFEHNLHDLVLLAALLGHLAGEFEGGQAADLRDALGHATVASRAKDLERALRFARAATASQHLATRRGALALLGQLLRRQGALSEAAQALEAAVTLGDPAGAAGLHLELAKLYEHRLRDPHRALWHARRSQAAEGLARSQRRILRLNEKAAGRADLAATGSPGMSGAPRGERHG